MRGHTEYTAGKSDSEASAVTAPSLSTTYHIPRGGDVPLSPTTMNSSVACERAPAKDPLILKPAVLSRTLLHTILLPMSSLATQAYAPGSSMSRTPQIGRAHV